jgi:hypothetical protein
MIKSDTNKRFPKILAFFADADIMCVKPFGLLTMGTDRQIANTLFYADRLRPKGFSKSKRISRSSAGSYVGILIFARAWR